MRPPQDNPEGYEALRYGPRPDLHGRLLLVHGTYDDNVHPQNTWRSPTASSTPTSRST